MSLGDRDRLGAFVDHCDIRIAGAESGPLAGLTFAVKDLFQVAGTRAGCGNPDWLATHAVDTENAPAVDALLAAGATLIGKTQTDELAYSLNGENHFYGAPQNVNAPGRIPGGSSSGSAAAAAGGLCDFALGTDTGGSVRAPASYCGLYGLRPTHDRIPLEGLMGLAPSMDTIGWFARDPATLARVGQVLLPDWRAPGEIETILIPTDAWALADAAAALTLRPLADQLRAIAPDLREITLVPDGIETWFKPFRIVQGWEIWRQHRDWIERVKPRFGPGVADRFAWVPTISDGEKEEADAVRQHVRRLVTERLPPGAVMALPTVPGIAPLRGQSAEAQEGFRYRALQLTGIASLAQVPQINLPLGQVDGCPVGLSLMAGRGGDECLLRLADRIAGPAPNGVAAMRIGEAD